MSREESTKTLPDRTVGERMRRVRRGDTAPELKVRRVLHSLGYRYRLHVPALPGTPDIVFKSRRKAIFVHGCFWHRHCECHLASTPKSNIAFWSAKFDANIARDRRKEEELANAGWSVLVVWQCETKELEILEARLRSFLDAR